MFLEASYENSRDLEKYLNSRYNKYLGMETFHYVHLARDASSRGTHSFISHIRETETAKERSKQPTGAKPMTYRGVEYAQPEVVEAEYDGKVLTYRGVTYAHQTNQLERIRRMKMKETRYRGARMVMAMT